MDNRRIWVPMVIAVAVALMWPLVLNYLYSKYPSLRQQPTEQAATQPSTAPTVTPSTGAAIPVANVTPAAASGITTAPSVDALRAMPGNGSSVALGSAQKNDPNYRLGVRLDPVGASIESVVLNEFKREAKADEPYVFQRPYVGFESRTRALGTRAITIDGQQIDLTGVPWSLVSSDVDTAVFSIDIAGSTGLIARITKTFELMPRSEDKSRGYELTVHQTVQNLAGRPLLVNLTYTGPLSPPKELLSGPDQMTIGGYVHEGYVHTENQYTDAFVKEKAVMDLTRSTKGYALTWIGQASSYFDAILRPEPNEPGQTVPGYIEKVTAEGLETAVEATDRKVAITLTTGTATVQPQGELKLPARAFFLPKTRELFDTPYLSQPPLAFNRALYFNSGPCGWCAWDWMISLLVSLLRAFHFATRDWGLAIIVLVILVRALLHPISVRSQTNMMKMQKLQPQMERIKKKYENDKDAMQRELAKLQMEQAPTMILGCLPMFAQMPIWIALYTALQTTFELRHAKFLWGLTWIDDLAKPDMAMSWAPIAIPLPFCGTVLFGAVNILPILLGIVYWWQFKTQPKPAVQTPEQEQQQKMMQWMMPLFLPLVLYNGPSGLNLYIITSAVLGILESKRIRTHLKEKEEQEKHLQIVDGEAVSPDRAEPAKKGKLASWIERMQQMAEDAKRNQQGGGGRRPPGKRK